MTSLEQRLAALRHKPQELNQQLAGVERQIGSIVDRLVVLGRRPDILEAKLTATEHRLNVLKQWVTILETEPQELAHKVLTWKPVEYKVALPPAGN